MSFGGGLWSAAPTSTRRVPILGAAGAENWHFGVASPMEITSLGLFRNADCTMRSGRYLVGRFLVSDPRSEFGKVFFLPFLHESVAYADLARVVLTPTGGSAPAPGGSPTTKSPVRVVLDSQKPKIFPTRYARVQDVEVRHVPAPRWRAGQCSCHGAVQ